MSADLASQRQTRTPRSATALITLGCLAFALGANQSARASELSDVAIATGSVCLGVGLASYAVLDPTKAPLPLALSACLGAAVPLVMPFAAMAENRDFPLVPLTVVPLGLIGLSAATSLLIPDWEVEQRTRLVTASVNGVAMGLALWAAGGILLRTEADPFRLTAPAGILTASAAGILTSAGAFALGTTELRRTLIAYVPMAGLAAGMLSMATYAVVMAARDETFSPAVAGSFITGGLALGSVTGLVLAALMPQSDPFTDEPLTRAMAISPMGFSVAF